MGDRERWRVIEDFPNYQVSNFGKVRHIENGLLKQGWHVNGYCNVNLYGKTKTVHRLVAKAFVPNPRNFPIIDHIDHNPRNNYHGNLRWVTYRANAQHRQQNTNNRTVVKARFSNLKLLYYLEDYAISVTDFARQANVSAVTIYKALRGTQISIRMGLRITRAMKYGLYEVFPYMRPRKSNVA